MTALLLGVALMGQSMATDFQPDGPQIRVTMINGTSFVITTYPKGSPKTVEHILSLVKKGFYDNQRVHRVEHWVTQWGDPLSKTAPMDHPRMGWGGSGKNDLPFEMADVDFHRGVVGVASEGLQMGGDSQLFVLKQDAFRLWHSYAVVGKVTEGMNVVGTIEKGNRIKHMKVIN